MPTFDYKDLSTMKVNSDLRRFLSPYDAHIQQLALNLRKFIVEAEPTCNELIWDNYNAVAIAYSKSDALKDAFCHLAIYGKHVNFGFNRGAELTISGIQLQGKGALIRHISVKDFETFPKEQVKKLLYEAIGLSEKLNPSLINATIPFKSVVMSISKNKRRPNN